MTKTNTDLDFKKNVLTAAIVGGVILTSLMYFLNSTATPSSAATPKVNISFSPSTGSYKAGNPQTAALLLQTGSSSQGISGYTLTIQASNPIYITDVSAPSAIGGGALNAQLVTKKIISNQKIQIGYVIPSASLPSSLLMNVYFYGTSASSGKISVDTTTSQVVGNISANQYAWGKNAYGSYSFTGAFPTLAPTSSITSSPVSCATQCDATGDRCFTDATNAPDQVDFNNCFSNPASHSYCYSRWDANHDGKIQITDFELCRTSCLCKP